MQDIIITAVTAAEKCTLFLDDVKFLQRQWSVKYRSGAPVHGACMKSVSRTTTMQGCILAATSAAEKCTLFLDST